MSRPRIPLYLNPAAGRGRAAARCRDIEAIFAAAGVDLDPVLSDGVGDLEERVRRQATGQPIVVAGGDGSVHEAVNGLLRAGSTAPFGLIPVGTGNDFAKAFGISLDWRAACRDLAARIGDGRPPQRVDAGRMNGRYFANGAGIGFDAKINNIARDIRWPLGDLVYLFAVLKGLASGVITPNVEMRFDGTTRRGPVTLANISNGPWVGGLFHIAPDADTGDGLFDLVIAAPVTRRRVLGLLPKVIRGRHLGEPEVSHRRIRDFELVADAPIPSHLDGEVQPLATEFRIELLPGALRVLA